MTATKGGRLIYKATAYIYYKWKAHIIKATPIYKKAAAAYNAEREEDRKGLLPVSASSATPAFLLHLRCGIAAGHAIQTAFTIRQQKKKHYNK